MEKIEFIGKELKEEKSKHSELSELIVWCYEKGKVARE